jgi:hypothetical protein
LSSVQLSPQKDRKAKKCRRPTLLIQTQKAIEFSMFSDDGAEQGSNQKLTPKVSRHLPKFIAVNRWKEE